MKIIRTTERPALWLWWTDTAGNLIDFSSGYTFTFKIGYPKQTALLTKTTGIVGAVGSGVRPSGVPNVVITPTTGELDIVKGVYVGQITATNGSGDRTMQFRIEIVDNVL